MSDIVLKPCPFCGNKDVKVKEDIIDNGTITGCKVFYIECFGIGCFGKLTNGWMDKIEMIKLWNKRIDTRRQALLDAAKVARDMEKELRYSEAKFLPRGNRELTCMASVANDIAQAIERMVEK